jgi:cob(I)alamin adenosyltransferase
MPKIYTKTGDTGFTAYGGKRVKKSSPEIHALGEFDRLTAVLGMALNELMDPQLRTVITAVLGDLYTIMGILATNHGTLSEDRVAYLEALIDTWDKELPPLRDFILPGILPSFLLSRQSTLTCSCHIAGGRYGISDMDLARTTCRVAETWLHETPTAAHISPEICSYVNRLSDMFFVFKRKLHHDTNQHEARFADLDASKATTTSTAASAAGTNPAEP